MPDGQEFHYLPGQHLMIKKARVRFVADPETAAIIQTSSALSASTWDMQA